MQRKLMVLFLCVLVAFIGLSVRLILINRDKGNDYKKQVLSQLEYDSVTIPFKRGEILDANGSGNQQQSIQCYSGYEGIDG